MVEVNAETDFVARNETFQHFVETVAELVLTVGDDIEALKNATWPGRWTWWKKPRCARRWRISSRV
jgi:elongation factor Ts